MTLGRSLLPVALAACAALSLGAGRPRGTPLRVILAPGEPSRAADSTLAVEPSAPCPPGALPDGDACVDLPDEDDDTASSSEAMTQQGVHRDRAGRWVAYDQVPRRPDRPEDYGAYRYPIPCDGCVIGGYDLDRPDAAQRRGRRFRQVGHGGVDLLAPRGTPVRLVALEHQRGDAEVIYAGTLFGLTVATRHTVREGGRLRDYVILFGHLDAAAAGVGPGAHLHDGDVVGYVGDSGSPSRVHLHLEARRVQDGIDLASLGPDALVARSSTVVCDPRNVLPLR